MSLGDMMKNSLSSWVKEKGPDQDIVLSSRIRLARNISGYPFPHIASDEALKYITRTVEEALRLQPGLRLALYDLAITPPLDRQVMVEKHLASPDLVKEAKGRAIALNAEETVSVMVNEEDHLRIQSILPGFQLQPALEMADRVDDALESSLGWAFCEDMGYLTACPTNAGTGLRASVMVHLPALVLTDNVGQVLQAVSQLGLAVRGLFGEGTAASGSVYQISNQITLGLKEDEIVSNLSGVVQQIIGHERAARKALVDQVRVQVDDRAHRALGILSHAQILSTQEAAKLLSELRLGIDVGLIKGIDPSIYNELLVVIQPGFLQKVMGRDMNPQERDVARATLVRERLG